MKGYLFTSCTLLGIAPNLMDSNTLLSDFTFLQCAYHFTTDEFLYILAEENNLHFAVLNCNAFGHVY